VSLHLQISIPALLIEDHSLQTSLEDYKVWRVTLHHQQWVPVAILRVNHYTNACGVGNERFAVVQPIS
jgi:hypothetical protein